MGELDDKWFADKFIEIKGDLSGIKANISNIDNKTEVLFDEVKENRGRIEVLEKSDAVQQNIIQRNPGKTLAIGGLSITTIAGIILAVVTKLMEVW